MNWNFNWDTDRDLDGSLYELFNRHGNSLYDLVGLLNGDGNRALHGVRDLDLNRDANGHRDADVLVVRNLNWNLIRLFNGNGNGSGHGNLDRVRSGDSHGVCDLDGNTLRHGHRHFNLNRDAPDLRYGNRDLNGHLADDFIWCFNGDINVSDDVNGDFERFRDRDHDLHGLLHNHFVRNGNHNFVRCIVLDDDLVWNINRNLDGLRNGHRHVHQDLDGHRAGNLVWLRDCHTLGDSDLHSVLDGHSHSLGDGNLDGGSLDDGSWDLTGGTLDGDLDNGAGDDGAREHGAGGDGNTTSVGTVTTVTTVTNSANSANPAAIHNTTSSGNTDSADNAAISAWAPSCASSVVDLCTSDGRRCHDRRKKLHGGARNFLGYEIGRAHV